MTHSFERWLQYKHSEGYHGTDDDMPDHFDNWLADLSQEVLINYADEWMKEVMATK